MNNKPQTNDDLFVWRDVLRRKHRTMTIAEYRAWCKVGDILDSPASTGAFRGGLTITFGPDDGYFGILSDPLGE